MTPKEKALKLYQNFHYRICNDNGLFENESNILCAKNCALIAVEELIKEQELWKKAVSINTGNEDVTVYWQDVKKEIEKL